MSPLRPVIASSLNKLTNGEHFINAFDEAIKKLILENDDNLPNKISRCFENCHPAFLAVKENINDLYDIFSKKNDLAQVSRVILSLETIKKSPNLYLVKSLLKYFSTEDLSGELKSNLCLIWTYELKQTDDFVKNVVGGFQTNDDKNPLKEYLPSKSSIWTCHLAQSVIVGANGEDLFKEMAIEKLFDIINAHGDNNSNTAYTKSLAILQCVSKHLSLVKKIKLKQELKSKQEVLLKKYETYALTNLNFGIDRYVLLPFSCR